MPYKIFTIKKLATQLDITETQLKKEIQHGSIKALLLREHVFIRKEILSKLKKR